MLPYDQKANTKIMFVSYRNCWTEKAIQLYGTVQSFQSGSHSFLKLPLLLHEGAVTNQVEMQ